LARGRWILSALRRIRMFIPDLGSEFFNPGIQGQKDSIPDPDPH
jgi:hypothetical protein